MHERFIITNGLVLYNQKFSKLDVAVEETKVTEIAENIKNSSDYVIIDAENLMVLPGFIDIHTHGGNNIDISNANESELDSLTLFYASQGVTAFLATVLTSSKEDTSRALKCIRNLKKHGTTGAAILGIHMEGPFLSKEFKGAMPEKLIIPCSVELFEEYCQLSGNNIKLITIAPESKNALDFIKYAKKKDIVVSLGHSGASYELCMQCIKGGAASATHLFNGMRALHHHEPSTVGACLESDIFCEVICDGRHLHPGIVRLILKTKGMDRVIAVTDSIMAAGLKDGRYRLGSNDIIVKDGDAQLIDGSTRAGSTLTAIQALKNLVEFTGKTVEECAALLSYNPSMLLGIANNKGSIKPYKDADIVIIDKDFNVHYTIVQGRVVYRR